MARLSRNILLVFSVLILFTSVVFAEDITITTYYPSPYGSYNELTTTGNTYLATTSGSVGIGTTLPAPYKLAVVGASTDSGLSIMASGGAATYPLSIKNSSGTDLTYMRNTGDLIVATGGIKVSSAAAACSSQLNCGIESSGTSIGVYGSTTNLLGAIGGYFTTASGAGMGVYGSSTNPIAGYGGYFVATGTQGADTNIGVYGAGRIGGKFVGGPGIGVVGSGFQGGDFFGTGYGIEGRVTDLGGFGVRGITTNGVGVYGQGNYDFQGSGGEYTSGGVWVNGSDRNKKENFTALDNQAILSKIMKLPITQWNFKTDRKTLHIGPVAQDFYAIFGLGGDNLSISTVDPSGIALVGIKALNKKIDAQQKEIDQLKNEIELLRKVKL